MSQKIVSYLGRTQARLRQSDAKHFGLTAVRLLTASQAYIDRDWPALKELAQDLSDQNRGAIRVARKHPDLFHPNVARSRQAENRIYQQVVRLTTAV